MKKIRLITTLLIFSSMLLSGCMTTWPIVNDLNHYKKWDTYESIRNEELIINNEEIEDNVELTADDNKDTKAIENCIDSRNNDPLLHEDKSIIEWHNQFENTESFCAEFVKTNPMFYNDTIWIDEQWEPIWLDWETIETE